MDMLKQAMGRMNEGSEPEPEPAPDQKEEPGDGEMQAMHHHKHKGKHSSHKIMSDGTAESEVHDEGKGGDDCPFCGGGK